MAPLNGTVNGLNRYLQIPPVRSCKKNSTYNTHVTPERPKGSNLSATGQSGIFFVKRSSIAIDFFRFVNQFLFIKIMNKISRDSTLRI